MTDVEVVPSVLAPQMEKCEERLEPWGPHVASTVGVFTGFWFAWYFLQLGVRYEGSSRHGKKPADLAMWVLGLPVPPDIEMEQNKAANTIAVI